MLENHPNSSSVNESTSSTPIDTSYHQQPKNKEIKRDLGKHDRILKNWEMIGKEIWIILNLD